MAKPKQPQQFIEIDKRPAQLSATGGPLANYFVRSVPMWNPPAWQEAEVWRRFVDLQQIAAICRDTVANFLNSLDWAVTARDSDQRDELKGKIKHYTKLFERGNAYYYDIDFTSHIEWIIKDLFTLPFGAASELGRIDDDPNGKVVWIRPLDGGTLAPTLNFDFPVVQIALQSGLNPVYIPRNFVSRVFLSPRTEIRREGWGFAPPERILRSMEMMSAGDNYYAQLLLNTPEAGILDLGDMEKSSAQEWVQSLRDLLYGVNPLKIPVLYEHTTQAKWIPFGKPPSEIMYDSITSRYAAILAAGYGLTLSDIGFPSSSNGGETLAGTIRQERVGRSSGKAIAKKKTESYFNKILPEALKFSWIDYDDERNVAKGRARLASAQASQIWIDKKVFLPEEVRAQNIADGLISIPVPETIDADDPRWGESQPTQTGSRRQQLGEPVAPTGGGQGEIIPQQIIQRNMASIETGIAKAVSNANQSLAVLLKNVQSNISKSELDVWEAYVDEYLLGKSDIDADLRQVIDGICDNAKSVLATQAWVKEFSATLKSKIFSDVQAELRAQTMWDDDEKEEPEIDGETLYGVNKDFLINTLARFSVLMSKSAFLNGKLDIDPSEATDNNIRVSREVAREVVGNLSDIIGAAYKNGKAHLYSQLGEQHAES